MHFCPFRCNVCAAQENYSSTKTTKIATLFCSDCKLISYCGQSHQKIDWKNHKQFCRAVHGIIKDNNLSHIKDKYKIVLKQYHPGMCPAETLQFEKISKDLVTTLKRKLTYWETEVCLILYSFVTQSKLHV